MYYYLLWLRLTLVRFVIYHLPTSLQVFNLSAKATTLPSHPEVGGIFELYRKRPMQREGLIVLAAQVFASDPSFIWMTNYLAASFQFC